MFRRSWFLLFLSFVLAISSLGLAAPPRAPAPWQDKVDPWVLETAAGGETEFLVLLAEQADLSPAAALPTKLAKGSYVYETLTAVAERTQGPVLAALQARGVPHRAYWVANMIWVRSDLAMVEALAQRADVAHVYANPQVRLEEPAARSPELQGEGAALEPAAVEWNITKVNAPSVWAAGFTGQGAVIGGQDTGYQWDHPALKGKYRGWNGTAASHDYNWHDAIHSGSTSCGINSPVPCDDDSHGTHTMGTMVGDDGGSNQIGMAPGAKWIGCRNMAEGVGSPTTYSECYQWFIAPTRVDGTGADPGQAPDVINNSWGCPGSEGCTSPNVLLTVVQNVRAAGILTVHSAGNSGSSCSTVSEPAAIYAESFSVGATDSSDTIASFSSRGPVTVDGSNRLKPNVSAPGVNIRSSVPTNSYQGGWNGTSMAGPHVAGQVALLISADPSAAGQVDYLEDLIEQSTVRRTSTQTCGGVSGSTIPNNTYGWGRIDALAAYNLLRSPFTLSAAPATVNVCAPADVAVSVSVSPKVASFQGPVTLSASGHPAGTTAAFSANPVAPPGSSTLTIGNTGAAAAGSYTVNVTGSAGLASAQTSFTLLLSTAVPDAPGLSVPADGSTGVSTAPTFTWNAVSQAASYDIQVATDPAFADIVASATGLTGTSYTPAAALTAGTAYYWRVRANNACGGVYSPMAAFVTSAGGTGTFCRNVSLSIPDSNTTGVTDSQTVATSGALTDLNVSVQATHTWVGDLIFTVRNAGTGTSVTIIDRPGVPASTYGCSGDNIAATLDDQAASPVESQCAGSTPTINGTFQPNNLLSAFNGQQLAHTWTLNASDRAGGSTGTLTQWCLIATYGSALVADYSDLASSYGVAWHTGSGTVRLGSQWTADSSFAATGDDASDDGVTRGTWSDTTGSVNLTVSGATGYATGWFDWNQDGDFADAGEQAFANEQVNAGQTKLVSFSTNGNPVSGKTIAARFRVYPTAQTLLAAAPDAAPQPMGAATDGEDEDYTWYFSPLAVDLASFTAAATGDGIVLAWETVSERDSAGFNLYRAESEAGPWIRLNPALIPAAAPGSAEGHAYTWVDATAVPGTAYLYRLEAVDLRGNTTSAGMIGASVQPAVRRWLPWIGR